MNIISNCYQYPHKLCEYIQVDILAGIFDPNILTLIFSSPLVFCSFANILVNLRPYCFKPGCTHLQTFNGSNVIDQISSQPCSITYIPDSSDAKLPSECFRFQLSRRMFAAFMTFKQQVKSQSIFRNPISSF